MFLGVCAQALKLIKNTGHLDDNVNSVLGGFFASKHHKLGSWQAAQPCSAFQKATTVSTWISLFIFLIFFSCRQPFSSEFNRKKKLYWPRAHEVKFQIVLRRDSAVKLQVVNSSLLTYQQIMLYWLFLLSVYFPHTLCSLYLYSKPDMFTCTLKRRRVGSQIKQV